MGSRGVLVFTLALAAAATSLVVVFGRSIPRLVGLRRPQGAGWIALMVPMLIGAASGGAWIAAPAVSGTGVAGAVTGWWLVVTVAIAAAAVELVFRGVVHGRLARAFPIMTPGGERFMSIPVVVGAVLSAVATMALFTSGPLIEGLPSTSVNVLWAAGALVVGVTAGMIRERSGSVWAAAAVHAVVAVGAWLAFVGFN